MTLGLTLFRDLTEAIVVGFALGAVLFIHRMAQAVEVAEAPRAPYRPDEGADPAGGGLPHPRRDVLRRGLGGRARRSTGSATSTGCW